MTVEVLATIRRDADLPADEQALRRELDVSATAEACASLLAGGGDQPRWLERELLVLRLLER